MYIYKGQIYDIIDSSSDWWLARLVRDVMPNKHSFCEQGWVPGSFLDRYEGHLGKTEEALVQAGRLTEQKSGLSQSYGLVMKLMIHSTQEISSLQNCPNPRIVASLPYYLHLKPVSNRCLFPSDAWGSTQNSRNRRLVSNKRLVVQRSRKIN